MKSLTISVCMLDVVHCLLQLQVTEQRVSGRHASVGWQKRVKNWSPTVDDFNLRWENGKPSNDLSEAGLLVHVLDGYGISGAGFKNFPSSLPPGGDVLWSLLGQPDTNPSAPHLSDRVAASIINKAAPNTYEPLNVPNLVDSGFKHLPFVMLRKNDAVTSRLSCCYSGDSHSIGVICPELGGGNSCTPGCGQQAFQRHRDWPPERLEDCLAEMEIDAPCSFSNQKYCPDSWNEIILDSFRDGGWNKSSMVAAVAIAHDASRKALTLAGEMHAAALSDIPDMPPLLRYKKDATNGKPFSVV